MAGTTGGMTLERNQARAVLRLSGACSMTSLGELKSLLVEGLASAQELWLEFDGIEELDVALLQLLWAAERVARQENRALVSRVPDVLVELARQAGFENFPGHGVLQAVQEAAPSAAQQKLDSVEAA
jgi:ABC-type transporter Mla MlaB component